MFLGTVGAQMVTLAFLPVLTRLYAPEHFGYLGIFVSVANTLLPIAAFTIPMAIVVAKSKKHAVLLSQIALLSSVILSTILLMIVFLFQQFINKQFGLPNESLLFYVLPLFVFITALAQITDYWAIRLNTFTLKSQTIFAASMLTNNTKLLLGTIYPSAFALVITSIVAPIFSFIYLFSKLRQRLQLIFSKNNVVTDKFVATLKEYKSFPLFQAPQLFLNAVSQGIPVIVLGLYFGPASAGYFIFAKLILMTPVTLISKSVGDVLFGTLSVLIRQGDHTKALNVLIRSTGILAMLGIFPLTLMSLWAEPIFSFIFGREWSGAGEYATWVAFWTFCILLNSPSLKVIIALNQQKLSLLVNLITLLFRLAALYVGIVYTQDAISTLVYYVLVSCLHNLVIITMAYLLLKKACNTAEH